MSDSPPFGPNETILASSPFLLKPIGPSLAKLTFGECITFVLSVANSGETLNVHVPKLNKNEVIVPASLALRFLNIDLTGGHANNFLVTNVSRALVDKFAVKCAGTTPQETVGYDIFKFTRIFSFHCMSANMLLERIQTEKLCKIRSNADDRDNERGR